MNLEFLSREAPMKVYIKGIGIAYVSHIEQGEVAPVAGIVRRVKCIGVEVTFEVCKGDVWEERRALAKDDMGIDVMQELTMQTFPLIDSGWFSEIGVVNTHPTHPGEKSWSNPRIRRTINVSTGISRMCPFCTGGNVTVLILADGRTRGSCINSKVGCVDWNEIDEERDAEVII